MMKFTPAILYSCIFVVDGGYSPVDHWMSARNDNFLKAGDISRLDITVLSSALSSPFLWVWMKLV